MGNNEFKNIDEIIQELKNSSKLVNNFKKLNGITFECSVNNSMCREDAINEVQDLSKLMGILPVSIDANQDDDKLFGVQYPELVPIYTDVISHSMYNDNFKFLFDNLKMKDPSKVTKIILIENIDNLTKHAINIYCRSNINPYKEKVEDYLNNKQYRLKINGWYLEYIDEYLNIL